MRIIGSVAFLIRMCERRDRNMGYPTIDFLFLSEEDMIKAGVKDMPACIDTMEEVIRCLHAGDYVMGG